MATKRKAAAKKTAARARAADSDDRPVLDESLIGAAVRLENEDYQVSAVENVRGAAIVTFARPEGAETSRRSVRVNGADLRVSESGWLYLPQRIGVRPSTVIAQIAADKGPELAGAVRTAFFAHPAWAAGRDDHALKAVLGAYGITIASEG